MVHQAHRLHRSRDNRFLFGVAGGLAEYFDVDPVLVRMAWILLTVATVGLAILFYIGLTVSMPNDRKRESAVQLANESADNSADGVVECNPGNGSTKRHVARNVFGVGLITIGITILLQQLDVLGSIRWGIVWPAAILLIGLIILLPSMVAISSRLWVSKARSVNDSSGDSSDSVAAAGNDDGAPKRHVARNVLGAALSGVGATMLLEQLDVLASIRWDIVWPVAIVLLGVSILLPSIIESRR